MDQIPLLIKFLTSIFTFSLIVISVVYYYLDSFPSLLFSFFCILFVLIIFTKHYIENKISIFTYIFFLVYIFPSIHLIQYIIFDVKYFKDFSHLWGVKVNNYMTDKPILEFTALFFSIPALAFCQVLLLSKSSNLYTKLIYFKGFRSQNIYFWLLMLIIGLLLSVISSPVDTIYTTNYRHSNALNFNIGFDSAWLFSYVILTFCLFDSFTTENKFLRTLKIYFSVFCIAFVVIYLQLLRGDRESLPLVFSLIITYFIFIRNPRISKFPLFKIIIFTLPFILVSSFIGFFRNRLTGVDLITSFDIIPLFFTMDIFFALFNGTWSAVLLTPLSVAGDFHYHYMTYFLGIDYLNIILSLPPGFICNIFDYVKPLDGSNGPAQDMRYGLGGVHASILPFRNFGIFGLYIISLLTFYVLRKLEISTLIKPCFYKITFISCLMFVIPHWLWYTEKILINFVIMWAIVSFLFKFKIHFK